MVEQTNDIVLVAKESGLEESKVEVLLSSFSDHFNQARQLSETAKSIVVTSEDQLDQMQKARDARLSLKNIRVEVEKTRKQLKEQALREGKAIDGIANIIKALVVPLEEHLEKQEKFAERMEAERQEKKYAERVEALSKYVSDISLYNLKDMADETFVKLLDSSKAAKQAEWEAEKKAEQERIDKEKKEREEQDRIRKENEELRKKNELQEKKMAEEREKIEKEKKRLQQEQQKKLDAERKKREAAELKLKQEKEAQEKEERERKQKEEAERKRIEDEQRKALLAPDKEKLLKLANIISKVELPNVQSKEAGDVIRATKTMLDKVSNYILEESKKL